MIVKNVRREKARLRLGLSGRSKSGKSRTSLIIATGLIEFLEARKQANGEDYWGNGRVLVIDSENESSRKYAKVDEYDERDDAYDFDAIFLHPPYAPEVYIRAIREGEKEKYTCIIIDSGTHEWNGQGGILDIVTEETERTRSKNSFAAWKSATARHNAFIETFLSYPGHVIVTMRSRVKHVFNKDTKEVVKLGYKEIQGKDMQYEFDMTGGMTGDNQLIMEGSRCPYVHNARFIRPTRDLATGIGEWLVLGTTTTVSQRHRLDNERVRKLHKLWSQVGFTEDDITRNLASRGVGRVEDLTEHAADEMISNIEKYIYNEERKNAAKQLRVERRQQSALPSPGESDSSAQPTNSAEPEQLSPQEMGDQLVEMMFDGENSQSSDESEDNQDNPEPYDDTVSDDVQADPPFDANGSEATDIDAVLAEEPAPEPVAPKKGAAKKNKSK